MKNFLVIYCEEQKHILNDDLLQKRAAYLKDLSAHGYFLVGGSFTNSNDAMLCIQAASEEQARELLNADPFIQAEYYKRYSLQEFTTTSENTIRHPDFISVTKRKLKDNISYADFYQAWLPPNKYFNAPVRVYNAQSVGNQSEIISVGLIWASAEDIHTESQRLAVAEKQRADKIAEVANQLTEAKVYMVRDENILGL